MKKVIINIIVALIIFGLGFFLGKNFQAKNIKNNDSFQAGWNAAKSRLGESQSAFPSSVNTKVDVINGSIQKINGNKITIKIRPLEPLADPSLDVRTIEINSKTKILISKNRDPEIVRKEIENFEEQIKNRQIENQIQGDELQPPLPFEEKEISALELKENQQVTVTASEDIKEKKEFIATQIEAQEI